ncbi:MAG: hypothetical protein ABW127_09815 [Candidatus Thiodiazotropha endolucinida]
MQQIKHHPFKSAAAFIIILSFLNPVSIQDSEAAAITMVKALINQLLYPRIGTRVLTELAKHKNTNIARIVGGKYDIGRAQDQTGAMYDAFSNGYITLVVQPVNGKYTVFPSRFKSVEFVKDPLGITTNLNEIITFKNPRTMSSASSNLSRPRVKHSTNEHENNFKESLDR